MQNAHFEQAPEEQRAIWDGVTSSIKGSFEDAFVGLVNGTTSWHDATNAALNNVLQSFIKTTAQQLSQHITIENLKSMFTKKSTAQMEGIKLAAAGKEKAIAVGTAVTEIGTQAPTAGAKAFSAMAGIPIVGPALGAAAMAAAMGAIMALMGKLNSAAGGWGQVPSDQLAMIHKNEMILPERYASPLRDQLEGGGTEGGEPENNFTINVSAMDASGFGDYLAKNKATLAKAMQAMARDMAWGLWGRLDVFSCPGLCLPC